MSKHVGEKCGKREDEDPDGESDVDLDGHHHTRRRVYKKAILVSG